MCFVFWQDCSGCRVKDVLEEPDIRSRVGRFLKWPTQEEVAGHKREVKGEYGEV